MPTNPDWGLHLVFYTECNPQTFERVFLCILQFGKGALLTSSLFVWLSSLWQNQIRGEQVMLSRLKEIRQSLGSSILGSVS